jgi:hypothetical protein
MRYLLKVQKEIEMGDDAEYYIEQQEEEALFKHSSEHALDRNTKPLLGWADGVGYEDENMELGALGHDSWGFLKSAPR